MCPLLKPEFYTENQYIFMENEAVSDIFFMVKGNAQFVLPRYKNTPYINVKVGD